MDNKTNNKKFGTPTIIIKDNILKCENSVIQMSNVSKCEIAPEPKRVYPTWAFVGLIVGFILIYVELMVAGISLTIACGGILFVIWCMNSELGTYLILELNSGSIMLFSCNKKDFLLQAQESIIECFNSKKGDCIINFSKCIISGSQIGENNVINQNMEEKNGV